MHRALLTAALLIALPVSALAVTGDCDNDGTVELPELVRGVVIALGTQALQVCEAFDANGNGSVDVVELIQGVNLSMTSQPTATPTPSETTITAGTPTDTPTEGATPTSTASPTVTPTVNPSESPTSTPSATATSAVSATSTASSTPTRTASFTPSETATVTRTPTATATRTATPNPTSTSTPTPTVTPTLPRFFALDFGSAGTGGIPCITTTINFQLLAGVDNVHDLRIDFCVDPEKFDVQGITCQAQNAGATIDPVEVQLACDLDADDPHGQVRVTAHGIGVNALPAGEVLLNCGVPVLPATTTGVYFVDYSIRGNTTGDQAFVDFGQSEISIFADDLSQGQCCGVDSQCSTGFCRGGYVPESNSACCESDCAGGVCNDPLALGTCLEQPGGEFHVSSVTYRSQLQPSVAVLDDGFVVAWHGNALDIGMFGSDIFARRYDRFGAPVIELTVNQALGLNQRSAAVASLGTNFVVVWSDPYGVYARRFDAESDPLAGQFLVNTYPGGSQYYTSVDSAADGSFVVVWDSYGQDGSAQGIFGQRFDSNANDVGTEFQVNAYTYGSQSEPTVRFDGAGSFVVVWEDDTLGASARRFDSSGAPVGTDIAIPDLLGRPGLDVNDDGSFVVVGEGNDGSYFPGLFARLFDSSGAPRGGRFQVNTYTFDGQTYGAVALDADGNFVVVWQSFGQDGYLSSIFGQRFDSKGAQLGSEFLVNSYTADDEKLAAIAAGDGAGGFVVVWQGNGGGNYSQILGQRLE